MKDKNSMQKNMMNGKLWVRLLFMTLFYVAAMVIKPVIVLISLVQFLFVMFTGKTNVHLLSLSVALSTYVYQIIGYISFNTEDKPFPFAAWNHMPNLHKTHPNAKDQSVKNIANHSAKTDKDL